MTPAAPASTTADSTSAPSHERRPERVHDRTAYVPLDPQEMFMVPLLAASIEAALQAHAAPAPPDARALDVGCARQPFRPRLEALGYRYTGLDVQQNADGTVDVIAPIDQPLPAELTGRGPFHFIFCTEVMEHVADWDRAFGNFAALLAPGGKLLITCPQFYPLHEVPYDFWRPTPFALRFFADRYGLRVVREVMSGGAWEVLGTAIGASRVFPRGPGLRHKIVRKVIAGVRRLLLRLINGTTLRRLVDLRSDLHLSNLMVLERPA